MTTTQMTGAVAVWMEATKPARLVWHGIRFTVSDTPTPLHADDLLDEAMTHPMTRFIGWRFQATNEIGETFVFDIHRSGIDQWNLIAVYS
jgi:hypothetical protein